MNERLARPPPHRDRKAVRPHGRPRRGQPGGGAGRGARAHRRERSGQEHAARLPGRSPAPGPRQHGGGGRVLRAGLARGCPRARDRAHTPGAVALPAPHGGGEHLRGSRALPPRPLRPPRRPPEDPRGAGRVRPSRDRTRRPGLAASPPRAPGGRDLPGHRRPRTGGADGRAHEQPPAPRRGEALRRDPAPGGERGCGRLHQPLPRGDPRDRADLHRAPRRPHRGGRAPGHHHQRRADRPDGRADGGRALPRPRARRHHRDVARGPWPRGPARGQGSQLRDPARRDPGRVRPDGLRPHRDRARALRPRSRGERGNACPRERRAGPGRHPGSASGPGPRLPERRPEGRGPGPSPVDRGQRDLDPALRMCAGRPARPDPAAGESADLGERARGEGPHPRPAGADALRREPAEGGPGPALPPGRGRAPPGRAHARDRHREQGPDLRGGRGRGRPRQGGADDQLLPAGAAGPLRPTGGDEPRPALPRPAGGRVEP